MEKKLTTLAKKILRELKTLFIRKHLREISLTLGTITFREWLEILSFLFFKRKSIVNGKYIKQFEGEFANCVGAKYAFSFGAGRMSFYAILKAMDIKEGDEVILPGYTCVVVPNAVMYCGAKPVYVDINPDTFVINHNKIEEKITIRTKAILAQPMFNQFCDMDAISKIAEKYNLKVIEDCAHALGADYNGKKAGNFSDAAFFTMEVSKIITTWMGGVAVTNDEALAEKLQKIQRNTDFLEKKETTKLVSQIVIYYILTYPSIRFAGKYFFMILSKLNFLIQNITPEEENTKMPEKYPVRLSNIQAKIGLNQLRNIDANLEHRRKIADIYKNTLKKLGLKVNETEKYNPAYIRYAFLSKDRESLKELFRNNQVELGEWFNSVLHPKKSSLESLCYQNGTCPIGEFVAEHSVNLPTHLRVKEKDAKRITEILRIAHKEKMLLRLDAKESLIKGSNNDAKL